MPANRYEPLNETHRRVAEEEEKRRADDEEKRRSAAGPDKEPAASPDQEAEKDIPEARLAAMEKELTEKVRLGRISESEKAYLLSQFDNKLVVERNVEDEQTNRKERAAAQQPQDRGSPDVQQPERSTGAETKGAPFSRQTEDGRDPPIEKARDDPSQGVPDRKVEREAEAAEYEITGRGEMTEARAARLARLQSIGRNIEREREENEGKGPERDQDSGGRGR